MKKINIREALLELDRKTNARYDLTTLYEACKLSEDDKKKVVQYIDTKEPPFMIGEFLADKCDAVCESIVGDDEVSEAEMKKIVDDINDGEDHTLWALMDKADKLDEAIEEDVHWRTNPSNSKEVSRYVYRKIAPIDRFTDDNSRYWDFDRGVQEGDDAIVVKHLDQLSNDARYLFSMKDETVDLDFYLDRMADNDTWYVVDNAPDEDALTEDLINVDLADLESKIRAAAKDVVVNKLGYDEGFADKYVVIEVGNTDAEDARVRVEVRADLSYEEAQEVADALNPIVKELDKDAYFDAVTHNTIEAFIRLDQSDDIVDEEAFNYWKNLFDEVKTRDELINIYKQLVDKRDSGSITWGTMDKLFDEVISPLNDRLEESLQEAAVGTMERPMTELQGTLSSILSSDWNAWAKIRHVGDAMAFLNEIAPQCKNRGYIEKIKLKLLAHPETNIQQLFTNIILAGDGQAVTKTGKSKRMAKDMKEDIQDVSLYLFPELTDEDLQAAKTYGLNYLGKNHGPDGSEKNCVVAGPMSALGRFADKYLGYELHPDYLYDDADDFAGDIVNESASVAEDTEYTPEYSNYIKEVAERIDSGEYDDTYEVCEYVANKFNKDINTVRDDINRIIQNESGSIHESTNEKRDIFCTDCDTITTQTYRGSFKDGIRTLGRFICDRCGCENDDDPLDESKSINEDNDERFTLVRTKSVPDSDGFNTDYTMYYDHDNDKYVFVFGDRDIYTPEDGYFDWESETIEQAYRWFDSYNGFADDDNETLLLDEGIFSDIKNVAKAAGSAIKNTQAYKNNIQPMVNDIKNSQTLKDMKKVGSAVKDAVVNSDTAKKVKSSWNNAKSASELEKAIKQASNQDQMKKVRELYTQLVQDGNLDDKKTIDRLQSLFSKKAEKLGVQRNKHLSTVKSRTTTATEGLLEDLEAPYTKEQVEQDIRVITHNFTDECGSLRCGYEEEMIAAYDLLKQHYAEVDSSEDNGWFCLDFNQKLVDEAVDKVSLGKCDKCGRDKVAGEGEDPHCPECGRSGGYDYED